MLRTTLKPWHALTPVDRLVPHVQVKWSDGTDAENIESTPLDAFYTGYKPASHGPGPITVAQVDTLHALELPRPEPVPGSPVAALVLGSLLVLTLLWMAFRRLKAVVNSIRNNVFCRVSAAGPHNAGGGDDCSGSSVDALPMMHWTQEHVYAWACTLEGPALLVNALKAVVGALAIDGKELVMLTRDAVRYAHPELHAAAASQFCAHVIAVRDAQLQKERAGALLTRSTLLGDAGQADLSIELVCPITGEIMADPVVCADGHSYERQAIEYWLAKNDTSPRTNLRLRSKRLMPNHQLRAVCHHFLRTFPEPLTVPRIQSQRDYQYNADSE